VHPVTSGRSWTGRADQGQGSVKVDGEAFGNRQGPSCCRPALPSVGSMIIRRSRPHSDPSIDDTLRRLGGLMVLAMGTLVAAMLAMLMRALI